MIGDRLMKEQKHANKLYTFSRLECGAPCFLRGIVALRRFFACNSRIISLNDRGQAALLAITVVLLLVILTTAAMTLSGFTKRASTTQLERMQAFYAAEAGINRALAFLQRDPMWSGLAKTENQSLECYEVKGTVADGVYIDKVEVKWDSVSPTAVSVTIKSTGSYRDAKKTLEAEATISYDPFMCGRGVTDCGGVHIYGGDCTALTIYSDDSLIGINKSGKTPLPTNLVFLGSDGTLSIINNHCGGGNNVVVYGNVYTPNSVFLDVLSKHEGSVAVEGDVYAKSVNDDTYIKGNHYTWEGSGFPGFPAIIDPSRSDDFEKYFKDIASSYGSQNLLPADSAMDLTVMSGVYYVDGDVTLSGTVKYSDRITIAIKGNITFDKCNITSSDASKYVLGLISLGDIILKGGGGSEVDAVILCGNTLCFEDAATINGSIATWGIGYGTGQGHRRGMCNYGFQPGGSAVLMTYDEDLFNCYPPGMPYTVTITSLREL